jgi:hypothetical protein
MMVRVIAAAIFLWGACLSSAAHAEDCFVLYKAKKDNPLKLHLGLMKIDRTCSDDTIEAISRLRLQPAGWSLLQIVNVSKDIEVEKIKRDLGEYFLKY